MPFNFNKKENLIKENECKTNISITTSIYKKD